MNIFILRFSVARCGIAKGFNLINLTTKCETNLRAYLTNNLEEIYLRNYLQDICLLTL